MKGPGGASKGGGDRIGGKSLEVLKQGCDLLVGPSRGAQRLAVQISAGFKVWPD